MDHTDTDNVTGVCEEEVLQCSCAIRMTGGVDTGPL